MSTQFCVCVHVEMYGGQKWTLGIFINHPLGYSLRNCLFLTLEFDRHNEVSRESDSCCLVPSFTCVLTFWFQILFACDKWFTNWVISSVFFALIFNGSAYTGQVSWLKWLGIDLNSEYNIASLLLKVKCSLKKKNQLMELTVQWYTSLGVHKDQLRNVYKILVDLEHRWSIGTC